MVDVKLGKKAARQDSLTLAYATCRTAAEAAPADAHWGHGLPFAMLGNDKYGDCVEDGRRLYRRAAPALRPEPAVVRHLGALQSMTWEFFTTYCDEAYVLLATEWIAAAGESPSRMAWGQLLAGLASL